MESFLIEKRPLFSRKRAIANDLFVFSLYRMRDIFQFHVVRNGAERTTEEGQ